MCNCDFSNQLNSLRPSNIMSSADIKARPQEHKADIER